MNLKRFIRRSASPLILIALCGGCAATHSIHVTHNDQKFEAGIHGRTMVNYQLKAPPGAGLPVESGGFFHPVTTPSGVVVTDEQTLTDGRQIGAAVLNHPENPLTLWHNHPDIRMMNPCIVAPAEVRLKAGKPLVLRYRVVTFDGKLPSATLDRLADEWAGAR